ncbi:MAG: hypothetical protein CMH57_09895 [Myxococcales bacterium]|nr:hypothetical protein [Myxococcales bacterium]
MSRLLLLLTLTALGTTACVERQIPLYGVACHRDAQCGADAWCVDGICSDTPSRPPVPDAGPTIDPESLRDQTADASFEAPPTPRLPAPR